MMFNRLCDSNESKDAIRELKLDMHAKYLKITNICQAKRYKKRDENMKVTETVHERKEPRPFTFETEKFDEFRQDCMYNINSSRPNVFDSQNDENPFVSRPSIHNYDEFHTANFKQEKKKGLLSIEKCLELQPGEEFPENFDLLIDYEITEVLDYGLSYRTTNEPSGKG